jgi:hypothetical protein
VDQISATTPTESQTQAQDGSQAVDPAEVADRPGDARAGFGSRGRARRRARFLRKARELAYRDLGGLVFNLHRFGQRNDELVLAKLTTLGKLDAELRTLEHALQEREPVTVLREPGITACPRCAAIHSSEDRFCLNCGLPMARKVDLPMAGPATATPPGAPPAQGLAAQESSPAVPQQAFPATAAYAQQPAPAAPVSPPPAPGGVAAPAPPRVPPGAPSAGAGSGPSPTTAPPATAAHAPVPAQPPAGAPGENQDAGSPGEGQEEATEILRPGAPRP